MKTHFLSALFFICFLLFSTNTAYTQHTDVTWKEHEGKGYWNKTLFLKNNFYQIKIGKQGCAKLNSKFEIIKQAEIYEENLKPNGKKLVYKDAFATNENLYAAFYDQTSETASEMTLFKINEDLTAGKPITIFSKNYASAGQRFKNAFSISDIFAVSSDKSKVAYVRQGNGDEKTIVVVVCDENMNVLWQKEFPKISAQKEKLELETAAVTNNGQYVSLSYHNEVGKYIIYSGNGQFEIKADAGEKELLDPTLITSDNNLFIIGAYQKKHTNGHTRLGGYILLPVNTQNKQTEPATYIELDNYTRDKLSNDDDPLFEYIRYRVNYLNRPNNSGSYILITRTETTKKVNYKGDVTIEVRTSHTVTVSSDKQIPTAKTNELVFDHKELAMSVGEYYLLNDKLVTMPYHITAVYLTPPPIYVLNNDGTVIKKTATKPDIEQNKIPIQFPFISCYSNNSLFLQTYLMGKNGYINVSLY